MSTRENSGYGWLLAASLVLGFFHTPALAQAQRVPPQKEFQQCRLAAKRYLAAGKFSLAIPPLEKASSLDPANFENGFDLATAYMQTGALDKARAEAARLLSIRNSADVHTLKGDIETAAHSAKAAASEYQIAAQMDPSEDKIFDFGRSLMGFQSDAAIRIFSYGVEKYPQSLILHMGLGEAYDMQHDFDKAAEILCQAADMQPEDPRPIDFLGKLPIVSAETLKQIDLRFSRFQKNHPDNAIVNYYLARDLLNPKQGVPSDEDLVNGERLLKNAIRLDPKLADPYFQLGRIRERKGQQTEAIAAYERAVNLDPQQETYHYRLAFVYRAAGQAEKARRELQTYERLHAANVVKYGPKPVGSPGSPE
jgi:tetratricopeptide (TPR) repeat protein